MEQTGTKWNKTSKRQRKELRTLIRAIKGHTNDKHLLSDDAVNYFLYHSIAIILIVIIGGIKIDYDGVYF